MDVAAATTTDADTTTTATVAETVANDKLHLRAYGVNKLSLVYSHQFFHLFYPISTKK